jgi:sugar phosphate isomerase/epimerase
LKGYSTALFGWSDKLRQAGEPVDYDAIFRQCKEAGFQAIEMSSTRLSQLDNIQDSGLQVSALYTDYALHQKDLTSQLKEEIVNLAERLAATACSDVLVNASPKGSWSERELKNEDDLKRQGEYLTLISELVAPYGMRVSMHNHAAEKIHAEADLRSVIDYADSCVGLCVDTGWAHVAGCNPLEWIRSYPSRIFSTHLRNQRGDVPTEDLLEGDMAIGSMVRELQQVGYAGWISLELWHRADTLAQSTMKDAARRSLQMLDQWMA